MGIALLLFLNHPSMPMPMPMPMPPKKTCRVETELGALERKLIAFAGTDKTRWKVVGYLVERVNRLKNPTVAHNTRRHETELELELERMSEASTRHAAALSIQSAWRECVSNPSCRVCRSRLLREFDEESVLID